MQRIKMAVTGLQCSLGLVILIEAILFLMPAAARSFSSTHMPNVVRLALGWGEIVGCILMLIPKTAVRGAWILAAVFVLAIIIHLLHGIYAIGNLIIYTAPAWAVAVGKGD